MPIKKTNLTPELRDICLEVGVLAHHKNNREQPLSTPD